MERQTHKIDATNKRLGRLASQIALFLRGKNKPEFEPNIDCGDFVKIDNVDKIVLTGKKIEQRKYYHHSGYPGGLRIIKLNKLFKENPAEVLRRAVFKMLPKNKLRKFMIRRLKINK